MSRPDVVRAWKDAEYRASLSATEIEMLPAHPAGLIEISDSDLSGVAGGSDDGIASIDWCIPPITITVCWSINYCPTITICLSVNFCTLLDP